MHGIYVYSIFYVKDNILPALYLIIFLHVLGGRVVLIIYIYAAQFIILINKATNLLSFFQKKKRKLTIS